MPAMSGRRIAAMGWLGDRFYALGRRIIRGVDSLYARASIHGDHPFFHKDEFPWVPAIEGGWRDVRAELDALMPYTAEMPNFQDISKHQRKLSQDDGWKTFFFYAYGMRGKANCERCPKTDALLATIPGMKTAFFSILAPGKHLPPHRGPYKGVLRLHLALIVPEPTEKCGIRVADETRHWAEGEVMIFDDAFDHEAWNDTAETRVVLFVDMVRPMRFPASALNRLLIWAIAVSPFVLGARGNYLAWERRFEKVINGDRPLSD